MFMQQVLTFLQILSVLSMKSHDKAERTWVLTHHSLTQTVSLSSKLSHSVVYTQLKESVLDIKRLYEELESPL